MISIAFYRFVFSWSKTQVAFIPNNFLQNWVMHKALRTSATIDSLFTTFSPSKREILFPEMILFFFLKKKRKGA